MTTFDERERAAEAKFVHDAEFRFRVEARRNKLLGRWAAEKLGRNGDAADAYVREVIHAEIVGAGEEHLIRKLRSDFDAAGADVSEDEIRRQMRRLHQQALVEAEAAS